MTAWVLALLPSLLHVSSLAPPEEVADRARFAESDLDYDRAADLWLEVIGNPETTDALRFEANLQAGAIERIRGNDTEARFHFQYVLRKDPDFRLPDETPPKVRNFFELVRQEVKADRARAQPAPAPSQGEGAAAPSPAPATTTAAPVVSPTGPATAPRGAPAAEPASASFPVVPIALLVAGAATFAVALGAVGTGALFGMLAMDQYATATASSVQLERQETYEAAQGSALVANVGFGASALCALGAVALVGAGGAVWMME